MAFRGENCRFWFPVVLLGLLAAYSAQKLVRAHVDPEVASINYDFDFTVPGCRGSIYDASGCPLVRSMSVWEYHLDPVSLTNRTVRPKGEKLPRTKAAIVKTIATALGLDYRRVKEKADDVRKRYQFLQVSSDPEVYRTLSDSRLVAGVTIEDRQVRNYLQRRRCSHVLGYVNGENTGCSGLEMRYNSYLVGSAGRVHGMRDARGRELYDKRKVSIDPVPGANLHLTIDHNIQYEAETALADGIREYGAGSGWCIVMSAKTGAVLAMVSYPDFDPQFYNRAKEPDLLNRTCALTYEPGSVMKVITAATGLDIRRVSPGTMYSTNRNDDRYYRLPGDGNHVWDAYMSVRDAVVHSSNIVIGKLGVDIGPKTLWTYMKAFGFGAKTGIELPGEETGILPHWQRWDKVKWSRAPIGQGVAVTALQLCSAYQAIANDGRRMQPHLVSRIVASDGLELFSHVDTVVGRPISAATSRAIRSMMLGVASPAGTARRAAIRGYSVAGKTGTAQKPNPGGRGYSDHLFRATFCGIVPSGVEKRHPEDAAPAEAEIVVLVTLDFENRAKFHQGGNSSGPIFRRIATGALRYLMVAPDRPKELEEFDDDDEFDRIMDERAQKFAEAD